MFRASGRIKRIVTYVAATRRATGLDDAIDEPEPSW